ncbi:MAG: hypothetical protein ABR569_14575 [Gaiellaceae bacterium]
MLVVTETAAAAIREIVSSSGLSAGGGLRLSLEKPGNGTEPEFGLRVVQGPQAGDVVVEAGDARVFLESAASGYFAGKVLDAEGDTFTFAPAEV